MHTASRRVRKTLEPDLDNASEGKLTRTACIASGCRIRMNCTITLQLLFESLPVLETSLAGSKPL